MNEYAEKDDFIPYDEYKSYNKIEDSSNDESFVHYDVDIENNLAILTLTECNNNAEYKRCLTDLFKAIKENEITNVAVDLRGNGGGNSSVANEFLKYIDIDTYKGWSCDWRLGVFTIKNKQSIEKNPKQEELLFEGNVFILTDVNSFSSAMDFAEYIKDNQIGLIIGEAPGNDPNSFGDVSMFKLPNSQLYMQISTKKWYRIDHKEGLIEPDIPCKSDDAIECLYNTIQP